jgi:choloylglycine hydrolase
LPGYAEYEKPDSKLTDKTLGAWELAAYLLGTCATLEEVKSALPNVLVALQQVPGTNISLPLHFYIGDNQGQVIVVEYVNGQRHVYDDPVTTLTNSPPFDWQLANLSNYVSLSPVNVPEMELDGYKIKSVGQGSGLTGIPGDYTPPSRFVRAALYSHWATPENNGDDTVRLGFHVLNTFDIFFGVVRDTHTDKDPPKLPHSPQGAKIDIKESEYTQWTVIHDRTNLKTYIRSYDSLQVQMVDLKKIDFKQPGFKQIDVQHSFIVEDFTSKARPLN